ncbi:hypothetical protein AAG570_002380 [Ranatra chinensis]|uniref:Uncharacterized protein n=1 Tax=Ranatra chinensis TaxID=642074 RepID=A0ABD0Y8C5_9HEMI
MNALGLLETDSPSFAPRVEVVKMVLKGFRHGERVGMGCQNADVIRKCRHMVEDRLSSVWFSPGYYVTQLISGYGFGLRDDGNCTCGVPEAVGHVLLENRNQEREYWLPSVTATKAAPLMMAISQNWFGPANSKQETTDHHLKIHFVKEYIANPLVKKLSSTTLPDNPQRRLKRNWSRDFLHMDLPVILFKYSVIYLGVMLQGCGSRERSMGDSARGNCSMLVEAMSGVNSSDGLGGTLGADLVTTGGWVVLARHCLLPPPPPPQLPPYQILWWQKLLWVILFAAMLIVATTGNAIVMWIVLVFPMRNREVISVGERKLFGKGDHIDESFPPFSIYRRSRFGTIDWVLRLSDNISIPHLHPALCP